jgi:Tfp pilus assembly protein PilF
MIKQKVKKHLEFYLALSVSLVTFAVFLPSLRNEFVNYDDGNYVYENPFIRSLDMKLLKSAFTGFFVSNWHPLTWLSHAFDYAMWGLNPLGHHLTNNVFHAVNTFLVVLLVVRLIEVVTNHPCPSLTKEGNLAADTYNSPPILGGVAEGRGGKLIAAGITGLLFGLHPIHVESVAWVSERKDLLCAFFYLAGLLAYLSYTDNITPSSPSYLFSSANPPECGKRGWRSQGRYCLTLLFFTLALMSKPMAVSLPFVLLILDWYLFRRIRSFKTFWTVSTEKLPFLALTFISSFLTISGQEAGGAIASLDDLPLASRVIVAFGSLISYLVKIALPFNLVPFYPYPQSISLSSLEHSIPIVIVLVVTATCIALIGKQKLWMSVWSYYVITLIPVLGIVHVGAQSMADRYTYLPSLGPFLVIGLMVAQAYEKVSDLNHWKVVSRMVILFIGVTAIVSMSYMTITQIGIWKNSITLWTHVIEKESGRVPIAYKNLGHAYAAQGLYNMAIEQYRNALNLRPDYVEAHNNLGNAYLSTGLVDMAIEQFQVALRLEPDYAPAHYNLANAYKSKGQLDMAIEQYQAALRLKPDYAPAHYNLGNAYKSKGQLDMAIGQYQAALSLKPDYAEAHFNLGLIYLNNGARDMARTEFELVLRSKPNHYKAQQLLNFISQNNN